MSVKAMSVEDRLIELGITLPEPAAPVANYVPYVISGSLVSISGQISVGPDGLITGKVGADLDEQAAAQAARLCAINIIAQLKAAAGGDYKMVTYDGGIYMPVFKAYPETAFGGEFETEADYRDPFVQELIKEKGGSIFWPPIRYSYNTINLDMPVPAPAPPSSENWSCHSSIQPGFVETTEISAIEIASPVSSS